MNAILNPIRRSLRLQLIFILVFFIVASVGFVVLQILPLWSSDIEDNVENLETQFVTLERLQVQTFANNLEQDIRLLGKLESVQNLSEALVDPDADPALIEQYTANVENDFFAFSDARRVYNQVRYLDATGFEVVRIDFNGEIVSIRERERLASKGDRGYFIESAIQPDGEIFVSRFDLNREGTPPTIEGTLTDGTVVPTLRYGIPVYVETEAGQSVLAGVVITNVLGVNLLNLLQPDAEDSVVFLVDQEGYYLRNSANPSLTFGFEPDIDTVGGVVDARIQDELTEDETSQLFASTGVESFATENGQLIYYSRIDPPGADYYWIVGNFRDEAVIFAPVEDATTITLQTTVGIILVSVVIGIAAIAYGFRPLRELTQVAEAVASGDRSVRSRYADREDEIGQLSASLNTMTSELDTLVTNLEARVEAATRDLQALVDVNLQTATFLETDQLLQAAAGLTKERFNLYHVQFYTLEGEQLVLAAGSGYVGRQMMAQNHKIALGNPRSVVAQVARDQKRVLIDDVENAPNFLPNSLLPDTKSEVALPLFSRGQFIGVMDLQSDRVNGFSNSLLSILDVLAVQLANAILNARLYESVSRDSRHELAMTEIMASVQNANSVDDVLKTAARELGRALRVPHTIVELELKDTDS